MKHIKKLLNILFVGIFFVACAVLIIVYASGYKLDLTNRQLTATGLIEVLSKDNSAQIFLNDVFVGAGNKTIRDLAAGQYLISVKKEGYHEWSKNVSLQSGEAEIFNNIILFKENPTIEKSDLATDLEFLAKLADTSNLRSENGEIFQNDTFVTRVSGDVTGLSWYPNLQYIGFTNNGKFKIAEIDGANQVEIFDKTSQSPAVFVNSGKTVIFENDGKFYRAEIR